MKRTNVIIMRWMVCSIALAVLSGCAEDAPKPDHEDIKEDVELSSCSGMCSAQTPFCDEEAEICVQCVSDLQCKNDKQCFHGFCLEEICTPGENKCVSNQLEICNAEGTQVTALSCAGGICVIDHCEECSPGAKGCGENNAQICNSEGQFELLEACNDDEICLNGNCLHCVPEATFCKNGDVFQCNETGTSSTYVQDCDTNTTGLVCIDGECADHCEVNVKFSTAIGCDYWAVDLDNTIEYPSDGGVLDAQNAQFAVIVSNPSEDYVATVVVSKGQEEVAQVKVPPLQLRTLKLPSWNIDGTMKGPGAYRIQSNAPINAYQFNPYDDLGVFSNDASLLLPENSLGKEYLIMSRAQSQADKRGYFTVIATESGITFVTIHVTAKTLASEDGLIASMSPGQTSSPFVLQQGDVLNIETDEFGADLTGSWVTGDQRIAVFGGSEAANVPTTEKCLEGVCLYQGWTCESDADCPVTCCADHLEQQLPPTVTWGQQYLATKSQPRGNAPDVWRVLASQDETEVSTIPYQGTIPTLDRGEWFEFESHEDFLVSGDKPILVGQFLASEKAPFPNNDICEYVELSLLGPGTYCKSFLDSGIYVLCEENRDCPNMDEEGDAGIGDPAFILSVPYEQYRTEYVFLVPEQYEENYVNIVAPIYSSVSLSLADVPEELFTTMGNGFFKAARIPVEPGVHRITGSDRIGVVVYGWSQYVSYGYPAGQNLDILTF